MGHISKSTVLGEVVGHHNLERVRTAVFNSWGVKVYGVSFHTNDTTFTYHVTTDDRLTQHAKSKLPVWLAGFLTALKAVE